MNFEKVEKTLIIKCFSDLSRILSEKNKTKQHKNKQTNKKL